MATPLGLLAAVPLSSFEMRAPKAGLDPAAFFKSLGRSFFAGKPTLICFEFPDSTFDTQILTVGSPRKPFRIRRAQRHRPPMSGSRRKRRTPARRPGRR